jgi:hypothetical protein
MMALFRFLLFFFFEGCDLSFKGYNSPEANSIRLYKGYKNPIQSSNLLLIFLFFLVYLTLWLEIIITQICSTFDERKKVHQHYCTVGDEFIFTLGRIVGQRKLHQLMGFVIDNLSFGSDLQMDSWIFTLFIK